MYLCHSKAEIGCPRIHMRGASAQPAELGVSSITRHKKKIMPTAPDLANYFIDSKPYNLRKKIDARAQLDVDGI